jgi:hypothetical protein
MILKNCLSDKNLHNILLELKINETLIERLNEEKNIGIKKNISGALYNLSVSNEGAKSLNNVENVNYY